MPNRKLNQLIRLFVLEVPAVKAAKEVHVNRHSAERVYTVIRECIVKACEKNSPFDGEVEVDESYFGGKQKYGRGRKVITKVPVFGILKRDGKVYTTPVEDVSRYTLRRIIKEKVREGSTIYSDAFASYDGLITAGYKHYRINHQKLFAAKRNHINGIENFWGFAKTKLRRYYGMNRSRFFLYLKEMEFRFNHRSEDLLAITRKIVRRYSNLLD